MHRGRFGALGSGVVWRTGELMSSRGVRGGGGLAHPGHVHLGFGVHAAHWNPVCAWAHNSSETHLIRCRATIEESRVSFSLCFLLPDVHVGCIVDRCLPIDMNCKDVLFSP